MQQVPHQSGLLPSSRNRVLQERAHKIKNFLASNPKTTFILLNAFCDLTVPNMIYKFHLSNVIMINLFVIANDKRFREIMTNNISATA